MIRFPASSSVERARPIELPEKQSKKQLVRLGHAVKQGWRFTGTRNFWYIISPETSSSFDQVLVDISENAFSMNRFHSSARFESPTHSSMKTKSTIDEDVLLFLFVHLKHMFVFIVRIEGEWRSVKIYMCVSYSFALHLKRRRRVGRTQRQEEERP